MGFGGGENRKREEGRSCAFFVVLCCSGEGLLATCAAKGCIQERRGDITYQNVSFFTCATSSILMQSSILITGGSSLFYPTIVGPIQLFLRTIVGPIQLFLLTIVGPIGYGPS